MNRPAPATRTLERCLACGGARLRRLPLAYEFEGRYPAAECRDCGMRFLAVQPVGESLAALYSAEYFEADYRCGRAAAGYYDEAAFRAEDGPLLDAFEALGPGRRLLEVGCAGGWLLKHARERGWQARGVELSASAVAHARSLGLEVHHGTLEEARLPAAAFDLVYMGDVLEHVPDCRATLAEVVRVLAPGGHLYLRGPITTNSLARGLALAAAGFCGRTLVLREPPYHLWEFRPGPLARLFAAVGLEVVSIRQGKIPPGRPHGRKSALEAAAMAAIDAVNLPLTRAFNVRGDRAVVVGRRPRGIGAAQGLSKP
jgi:2-polyprenyl-3-methyl-5-hydroxy-6-metoxy-1,4-benzoquinol methylase